MPEVPRAALRHPLARAAGRLHAPGLRVRGDGDGALLRRPRAPDHLRAPPGLGHRDSRRHGGGVHRVRGAQGRRLDGSPPGHCPARRRRPRDVPGSPGGRRVGRVPRAGGGQAPHGAAARPSRAALVRRVLRRAVDCQPVLLGLQPVHHPARPRRAGRAPGALRGRARGVAQARAAVRHRGARHHRLDPVRGRARAAGPGLPHTPRPRSSRWTSTASGSGRDRRTGT